MSGGFKDLVKNGWHPEKTGSSLKGQVNGLLGRSKGEDQNQKSDHVARPLASLQDPSTFAPPPKRRGAGLAPTPPPVSTPGTVPAASSKYQDPRAASPHTEPHYAEEQQEEEEERAPRPYRMNTTGVSTAGFAKPPERRDGADGRAPPPYQASGPPSLPPRLPPRTNSASSAGSAASSPAPTGSSSYLNQGAVNRLGAAGVSVPGFGIGRSSPAATNPPSPPPPARTPSHMNELQNRFSKLGSPSATPPQNPPAQGTTWAQKQATLKTASSFHKDPSSVSFADAKAAASTANNFRQRHGEQVASGLQTANNLNQKYGVAEKIGGFASNTNLQTQTGSISGVAGKKKPPPPPPKKKPGLGGVPVPAAGAAAAADDEPPPIPMSTRPQV